MQKKVKIYTLGCKVNQYDSGSLAKKFLDNGFVIGEKNAHVAIINTCSVTKSAIRKNREMIKKAQRENPSAKIIMTGCWPVNYKDEVAEIGADFIFGANEADLIIKKIVGKNKKPASLGCSDEINAFDKSRYFIKVQDGCEQYCTYCIIPYNRGKLKTRTVAEVVNEVKSVVQSGFREVVLNGIHLGLFGVKNVDGKKERESSLVELLKEIVRIKDMGRVRLSSIEINEVTDDLIGLMAENRKLCRHLHIPLQAGTDKVLKLMNRPYDLKFFQNRIGQIRKKIPDIAITTDVIVGFPGETEKDFDETVKNIKKINFSRLHVFSFSPHEKTPAFRFPGRVDGREISHRSRVLRELSLELQEKFEKKFKNKELDVVIERISGNKLTGKTEYYFDVEFEKGDIVGNVKELRKGNILKITTNK